MQELEQVIEHAFDNRQQGFDNRPQVEAAVEEAMTLLDSGEVRVAEKRDGDWHVNQWLKKAVLLSFGLAENKVIES
ncbi:MAG: 2,3,4,5-tetrahydropyridine-2,6-dicarboxylate N-succinyltransferase, partial [Gammaproteobacteria bacterium]|nr:2,3,4,5-tetrahydropyridine-2,6-dicarboxylate N-succinyltransferase [Gammaproteobacteria bacterium]